MSLIVYLVLAIDSDIALWRWGHVRSSGSLLLLDLLLGIAVLMAGWRLRGRGRHEGKR